MASLEELEQQIEDLRAQIHSVAKGDELKTKAAGFRLGSIRIREVIAGILETSGFVRLHYGTDAERQASTDYHLGVVWCTSDTNDMYHGTGAAWQMIGGASGAAPGAHGRTSHTTDYGTWKVIYTDASGDQQEIAVGADGTVLTGTGAASAPAFEAADEHAHSNDHAQAHGPADHTGFANWKVIYTDASGDQQEVALGADGTFFQSGGASTLPEFTALVAGDIPDVSATYVTKALFDADTFLHAVSDNTPVAVSPAQAMGFLSGHATAAFSFNDQIISGVKRLVIDSTPANDTCTGIAAAFFAGAALTRGDCCYVGSDGKMEKCDADAEATARCIAIVESATIAENAEGYFLLQGFFEKEFNFATVGARVYLDTATAGGVTLTAPSGADDCIVIVGISVAADCLYFNPTVQAIVEHTG